MNPFGSQQCPPASHYFNCNCPCWDCKEFGHYCCNCLKCKSHDWANLGLENTSRVLPTVQGDQQQVMMWTSPSSRQEMSDAFWALQRTQYLCQIDGTFLNCLHRNWNLKLSGNLNFMQNCQLLLQMTITGRVLAIKQMSRLHKFYLGWLPVFVGDLQVKTTTSTLNLGDWLTWSVQGLKSTKGQSRELDKDKLTPFIS